MATFKIGDKVKFLNQIGGGRVSKIMSALVVNVEDENGFEIPTMVNEIVLDATNDKAGKMFVSNQEDIDARQDKEATQEPEQAIDLPLGNKSNREIEGIYLCFIPHNQKWLITGEIDVWLINNTTNDVIYSCFLKMESDNNYAGFDYGSTQRKTQHLLTTIYRDELSFWSGGIMQLLIHYEQCVQPNEPLSLTMPIKEQLFFIESSYVKSSFFEEKAIIFPLFIPNKL